MSNKENIVVLNHPIVEHYLYQLRAVESSTEIFRNAIHRIGHVIAQNALESLDTVELSVTTPIQQTSAQQFSEAHLIVPILRAGLSLVDPFLFYLPNASVGHLGMYRDEESHQPIDYYSNIPKIDKNARVFVVDPMLATGGSAIDALNFLKNKGFSKLHFCCVIAAPEGIKRVQEHFPDVQITVARVDEKLNENAFIVPGLGDAGDRFFRT